VPPLLADLKDDGLLNDFHPTVFVEFTPEAMRKKDPAFYSEVDMRCGINGMHGSGGLI
jgi:hypothetical protein